jgi:hypothetical protein
MWRVFRLLGTALAALILSGQAGMIARAPFAHLSLAAGTLLVVPTQGTPGTQVSVTAAPGVLPVGGTQLVMFRDSNGGTNTTLGRVQAAADGSFSGMWSIPVFASGGTGAIYVQGYPDSSTPFTVLPTLAVSPTSALPGTFITLTGRGYKANAQLISSLDGMVLPLSPNPITDLFGNLNTMILLPRNLLGGQHTVTLSDGTAASASTSATFTVLAPTATPTITSTPTASAVPTRTFTPVATVAFASATPGSTGGPTTVYLAEGYTGTAAGNGKVTEHRQPRRYSGCGNHHLLSLGRLATAGKPRRSRAGHSAGTGRRRRGNRQNCQRGGRILTASVRVPNYRPFLGSGIAS